MSSLSFAPQAAAEGDANVLVMIGIVAVAAVALFVALRWIRSRNAAVWKAYAARHDMAYTPSTGFGPAYRGPRMEGIAGGVPVLVDSYFHRLGRGPMLLTRVSARATPRAPLAASVRPRGAINLYQDELRGTVALTGDARFDTAFTAGFEPIAAASTVLPAETRASLLAFATRRPAPRFDIGDGQVVLRWFGYEKDDAAIDEACALVAAAARALS